MKHAAPWELLVRRRFRWKLIHDHKLESSRNRAKRGLDILAEPDDDEFPADIPRDPQKCHVDDVKHMSGLVKFSQPRFLQTSSQLLFLASLIQNFVMHLCCLCAS